MRRQQKMGTNDTLLAAAIREHNSAETTRLAGVVANIDSQTKKRCTALYTAVECNNIEAAVILLERGASINIIPKKRIYQDVSECPIMLALKMGASHEEMQLLFLDKLASVRGTWSSNKDKEILETVAHSAMLYTTPCVFFRATAESRGEDTYNKRGLNALMTTLRQVVLFANDATKCARTLENVLQIVNKHPAMAWECLKHDEECGVLVHTQGLTALGMLVYQFIPVREIKNRQFQAISEELLETRKMLETGGSMSDSLVEHNKMSQTDIENNSKIVLYILDEFVPALWTIMLRPLRIALAMGTHHRLGSREACVVNCLNTDTIDIIFRNLILDITIAPQLVQHILC